jgi:hypothetical protein
MAHGTPLGFADNDERYGNQGAFLLDAGISSSYHIANFFGLTAEVYPSNEVHQSKAILMEAPREVSIEAVKIIPKAPTGSAPVPEMAERLRPLAKPNRAPEPRPRRAIDVGTVITRALTAAGLLK